MFTLSCEEPFEVVRNVFFFFKLSVLPYIPVTVVRLKQIC